MSSSWSSGTICVSASRRQKTGTCFLNSLFLGSSMRSKFCTRVEFLFGDTLQEGVTPLRTCYQRRQGERVQGKPSTPASVLKMGSLWPASNDLGPSEGPGMLVEHCSCLRTLWPDALGASGKYITSFFFSLDEHTWVLLFLARSHCWWRVVWWNDPENMYMLRKEC